MNRNNRRFWHYAGRLDIVLSIIIACLWIVTTLKQFKFNLNTIIPSWWLLVTAFTFLVIGFLLGRRFARFKFKNLIRKIDFDYKDTPLNHKWYIVPDYNYKEQDGAPLAYQSMSDGHYGDVLQITLKKYISINYDISPAENFSKMVVFLVKFSRIDSANLYCKVKVQSKNRRTSMDIWLNIKLGSDAPRYHGGSTNEWDVFIKQESLGHDWILIEANLPHLIRDAIGKDGWIFRELNQLRLRGELTIANISIYK